MTATVKISRWQTTDRNMLAIKVMKEKSLRRTVRTRRSMRMTTARLAR